MNRKSFLTSLAIAGGLFLNHKIIGKIYSSRAVKPIDGQLVKEFVTAGHNDLNTVRSMISDIPGILHSTWDWGNGDFETAIEGAGHMGNVEIVEYLIENGARPNIFTMAMLGEYEIVKRWIQKYPPILTSRGPHGFSLLHHAEMAGNNSDLLSQYLRSEGLTTVKFS